MPPKSQQQPELPWATKRGQELKALRLIDLSDPQAKLLLLSCDLVVSQETGFYDLELDELRRIANMSRTTFYDRLKKLQRLGLISYSPLHNSPKQRVWVHRGAIAQMADNRTAIAVRQPNPVRRANAALPIRDSSVRQWDEPVPYADESVRRWDCTTTEPTEPTEPPAPPENVGEAAEATWELVRDLLIDLGVLKWDAAIASLQQHVTPGHAIALCRHYQRLGTQSGWTPVTLFFRCQRARQSVATDANWPPPEAPRSRRPAQSLADLESQFGEVLDAMSVDELGSLVRRGDLTVQCLFRQSTPRQARAAGALREHLLRLVSRTEMQDVAR
ncbi:hypothetical protein SH661x_001924 [Planctomicrobium sp. SH661]|uniref:hypothetical protein n=1 Tax=Planctomicrobium sp. SH661 TaxID=3448124 RepID=UPI003F5C3724